ncbi:MAG: UDP-N-acetylmuramoyl-tripeptide--D-alanyl-D-alanine ligase [Niameybacter sp.]|uniref:UDP-N-acetylmuramoyl-tripeptide--D-alanyl-D- alanine ligase n=1 Tax=Niameybacter sp. TaxID=2033640 RepID=UPI002FC88AFD
MKLLLQDIIAAIGGRCLNAPPSGHNFITAIETDSRKIKEGSLFVPLKGERFDAHEFIASVISSGASATLTEELTIRDERILHIFVADTKKALLDLAAYYRSLFQLPVIAVTGSVGKTSTKDMIAAVLSAQFNVLKTQGNFNNEIGLPLTLFNLSHEHEVAVIEMGMNHFDEIHRLSLTVLPDMGVITNVGTSHIENLGSREGILKAKLELLDGLKEGGFLCLNGDNDLLAQVEVDKWQLARFGEGANNDYRCEHVYAKGHDTYATVITPSDKYEVVIPALGIHMVYNSLVAIAIGEKLGMTKEQIQKGLLSYTPSKMRMNISRTEKGITLLDDAYNASLDSMCASLKVLEEYETKGRHIAVLGDMFEMGEFAKDLHEQVGQYVAALGIDKLYAVGDLAIHIAEGAMHARKDHLEVKYYKDKADLILDLEQILQPEDTVLLKASRGMQFEEIVKAIGKVNDNE